MALSLEDIAHLLATRGVNQYGREAVSQLEHALQCAQWAEKSGETPATVAAALLHDLGHLLAPGGDTAEQDISTPGEGTLVQTYDCAGDSLTTSLDFGHDLPPMTTDYRRLAP